MLRLVMLRLVMLRTFRLRAGRFSLLRLCAMLSISLSAVVASAAPQGGGRADPLTVELLTMGPGEHPFFKFGHNGLRIRDAHNGTDIVYNFGTFSFSSPTLLQDFFKGRLEYWLSREGMTSTVGNYREENRSMIAQRLALSPAAKRELQSALERNALPANRAYKYDYFFDNCSTRLRDALDRVTGGRVHAALRAPAQLSLRDHALRATADYFLEYLVLSIGLGPMVDQHSDRWGEAFLPEMLGEGLRHVTIPATDGSLRPLVGSEKTLLEHRDTRPARAPQWGFRFFLVGLFAGLSLLALSCASIRHRAASITLGVVLSLGGLLIGLLGFALVGLWTMTDHAVAYRNQNILLFSPFALGLVWYGFIVALRGVAAIEKMRHISLILSCSATVALAWKLLPLERQDNSSLIAFFLPFWAGLLAATWTTRCHRGTIRCPGGVGRAEAEAQ